MKAFTRQQKRTERLQVKKWGAADLAGIEYQRERRVRTQKGVPVEYADGWYVRYYKDDEHGNRVRLSHRLGDSEMARPDRDRAQRAWMKDVNAESRHRVGVASRRTRRRSRAHDR